MGRSRTEDCGPQHSASLPAGSAFLRVGLLNRFELALFHCSQSGPDSDKYGARMDLRMLGKPKPALLEVIAVGLTTAQSQRSAGMVWPGSLLDLSMILLVSMVSMATGMTSPDTVFLKCTIGSLKSF